METWKPGNLETWKPVVGYTHYEVSDQGRVRSLDRFVRARGGFTKHIKGRLLKPLRHTGGYVRAMFWDDGQYRQVLVHKVVLEAFVGPRPLGFQACHADGDRQNNRLNNLRWDTAKANHADRIEHGTMFGRSLKTRQLTKADRAGIAAMAAASINKTEIGRRLGVPRTTVNSFLKREVACV